VIQLPYVQHTAEDQRDMLGAIGVDSIADLFANIPPEIRRDAPLDMPRGQSEYEVMRDIAALGARNRPAGAMTSFLGAGIYDGIVPSAVGAILSRSEFYTAYTPYQPEISQGTLQTIYEFQTMVSRLTGMDLANASMYDGATALAECSLLMLDGKERRGVLAPAALHPGYRAVLDTYASDMQVDVTSVPHAADGRIDVARLASLCAGGHAGVLVVQQPNFFGLVEDTAAIRAALAAVPAEHRPELVACVEPISLGMLVPPGEYGAAIAVGEGQPLGLSPMFGGPLVGFVACAKQHVRRIPGRLVGATVDGDGRRGYVLTLQTREQHIRREKATSNICTNQALLALAVTVYLTALGEGGLRELAHMCLVKAHRLADAVRRLPGYSLRFDAPFFREFVIRCPRPAHDIVAAAKAEGVLAGLAVAHRFPNAFPALDARDLLVAVTEKRTEAEIDAFAALLGRLGAS
jgi:glycine dehydrogenase subunit 1